MLNDLQLEVLWSQPGVLSRLADYLRSVGYTLSGVAQLVEEPDPTNFISNAGFCAFVYDEDLKENASPLALLARMFLMGSRAKSATYRKVFPEKLRELLEFDNWCAPARTIVSQQTYPSWSSIPTTSSLTSYSRITAMAASMCRLDGT
jgi:hypothetical protein